MELGCFFAGVVTTGVYCRPGCPVAPPKPENVRWLARARAAAAAGFRPCRRCRPESSPATPGAFRLRVPYRPPFAWSAIVRFLSLRATAGVESADETSYRRTVEVNGTPGTMTVRPGGERYLVLEVVLPEPSGLPGVVARVRRLFDLDVDPLSIVEHLRRNRTLAPLVEATPGLRVPGAWDPFELAVRAVLGQQVSVPAASTLAGRLVRAFGRPVAGADARLSHLFPRPESLADADLSRIGIPRARADTIRALAAAVACGELALDAEQGLEDAVARLCALPGIGPWTAHYVAMRALAERDAFPASDLGLRRALGNGNGPLDPAALERIAESWRPWRAYAALHLWTARRITS